jgi:hypothetical protein
MACAPRAKASLAKIFNTQLIDFITDLIAVIPGHPDLIQSRTALSVIAMGSPAIIIKIWHPMIYTPYSDRIDAGDVSFFIDKDYSADLAAADNAVYAMGLIDRLRAPIRSMDAVNHPHIMKYIRNLSKLSAIYAEST